MSTEGSMFTGYNGLGLAVSQVFGTRPAWFAENAPGPSAVLAHHWPGVPNLGDVAAVDWRRVEPVDVLSGGFPCQDVSLAGRRAGLGTGTRSGLWAHMAEAVDTLRPRYVVAENVRGILSARATSPVEHCPWCLGNGQHRHALRALGAVLGDLADIGYDARWCGLRASDVGAPHARYRIFVLAADARSKVAPVRRGPLAGNAAGQWWGRPDHHASQAVADGNPVDAVGWQGYGPTLERWGRIIGRVAPSPVELNATSDGLLLAAAFVEWMQGLPAGHVTDVPGMTRSAQLRALGNGVVPQQATAALTHLLGDAA